MNEHNCQRIMTENNEFSRIYLLSNCFKQIHIFNYISKWKFAENFGQESIFVVFTQNSPMQQKNNRGKNKRKLYRF